MRFANIAALGGIAAWIALAGTPVRAQEAAVERPEGVRIVNIDAAAAAAKIQRSGKFRIRGTLQVNKALPAGTVLSLYATASAASAPYGNYASLIGTTKVAAGKATFAFDIPYKWLVASTSAKAFVSVSVGGGSQSGTGSRYYTSSLSRTITLPANGATTVLNLAGAI